MYIDGTLIDGNITSSPYQYTTTLTSTTTFSGDPTAGSNINVAIKDGKNCDGTVTGSITFTVHPLPANPTGEATQFFCATTPAPTVANLVATGDNIQWFATADPTAQALLPTQTLATGSTYYAYSFSGTSPNCPSNEYLAVTVTIYEATTIATIADVNVCSDHTATMTAVVSGGGGSYTYQWEKFNPEPAPGTWVIISGANSSTYEPTAQTTTSTPIVDQYRVKVETTSASGCGTVESNTITFTTYPATTIATIADVNVCSGHTETMTAVVSGGGGSYTYQWEKFNPIPAPGTWETILGANSYTYEPTAQTTTSTPIVDQYRVIVETTSANGCGTVESNTITFTTHPSIVISTHPQNHSVCQNTLVELSVTATGGNALTYQWQQSDEIGGVYTNIDGETNSTYNPVTTTVGTKYYQVVVSSSTTGCGSVTSNPAEVTVHAKITIAEQPTDKNVCSGSTAELTVVASGGGTLNYQWQKRTSVSPEEWVNVGTNSNTFTTLTQKANPGTTADTLYRVIITSADANGCGELTSSTVTVSTSGGPQSTFTLKDVSCYGGNDGEIKVTVTAGIPNFTLNLYEGETTAGTLLETGSINSVTHPNNTFTFTGLTAKKYTVSVKDAYGCDQKQCPTP